MKSPTPTRPSNALSGSTTRATSRRLPANTPPTSSSPNPASPSSSPRSPPPGTDGSSPMANIPCGSLRLDPEAAPLQYGRFLLVHSPHIGPARSLVKQSRELLQRLRRTACIHLHASVVQVPHISAQPEALRRPLCEIPVSHTLHPPAHEPPPRFALARHLNPSSGSLFPSSPTSSLRTP